MSNPWHSNEPTDAQLWDELSEAGDPRKQEIFFLLGQRAYHAEKYNDALPLFEQSLALCESLNYTRDKYFTLMWLTRCHRELQNWDKVVELFSEIEATAVPDLEPEDLAQMFRSKGFAMRERRRAHEAIDAFALAEKYSKDVGESHLACLDAVQRAKLHAMLREYRTAIDILRLTLDVARDDTILPVAAITQYTLGKVYLEMGNLSAAIPTLEDAVTCLELSEDHHLADAKLALASAFVRAGRLNDADGVLIDLEVDLKPWDTEVRSSLYLLRAEMSADPAEVATWHKKARAIAANDGVHHVVHVIDVNIAVVMAEMGDLVGAENLLRETITSAERYDNLDLINEARVRLASILVETERSDEALQLLETLSIATFGEDSFGWQRYALVRAAASLRVGNIDDAEETVRVIMNLERSWANLPMISEAYWITSQIEERRFGRTPRWEHMLSASVAMTLQTGNTELATERSRDLIPTDPTTEFGVPRQPITSADGIINDITEAND